MKTNRPLVLLLLAAVLPLLILSAVIGAVSLRQEQAAMEQDARARVRLVSTMIERVLDGQVAVLAGIARSPRFDQPSPEEFVSFFDRIRQGQPQWLQVKLTDPTGLRLAQVPELPPGPDRPLDPDSHQHAVAARAPTVGAIVVDPAIGAGFPVRAPIVRAGRVKAVISALVAPAGMRRLLETDELPRGWRAAILDGDGRLVAVNGGVARPGSDRARTEALAARRRGPEGLYEGVLPSGERTFTAYRVIPRYGWSVHVLIPLEAYRAPLRRAILLVAMCGGLGLMLAAVFLTLLAREVRLRQREQAAAEQARRIEALGRITGGVAHDFNNILMIVQGSAEMLSRRAHDPDRVGVLAEAILTASRRGQSLTRQLLTFARRGSHEPVAFSLPARLDQIVELLRRAAGDAVEVEVSIAAEVWPVFADPHGLEIALINLAVNARDAMPAGGRLSLTAANAVLRPERGGGLRLEGDFVVLTVRDTGSGISEEHLAHVFEPFFTTKPPGKGTGLGLSQVYGFAQQSGGAATVTSRPGHGTAFTLYLPRARGLAASETDAPAPKTEGEGRLLVVDDDPQVREATAALLEAAGYVVVPAAGPQEALERLSRDAFDAVLSDIVMPGGLSGLELAARIRTLRPHLPVVLMTGYSEALTDEAACPWPVLSKPFTAAEAVAALGLARRRAA